MADRNLLNKVAEKSEFDKLRDKRPKEFENSRRIKQALQEEIDRQMEDYNKGRR